jgi:hypothetical protein
MAGPAIVAFSFVSAVVGVLLVVPVAVATWSVVAGGEAPNYNSLFVVVSLVVVAAVAVVAVAVTAVLCVGGYCMVCMW